MADFKFYGLNRITALLGACLFKEKARSAKQEDGTTDFRWENVAAPYNSGNLRMRVPTNEDGTRRAVLSLQVTTPPLNGLKPGTCTVSTTGTMSDPKTTNMTDAIYKQVYAALLSANLKFADGTIVQTNGIQVPMIKGLADINSTGLGNVTPTPDTPTPPGSYFDVVAEIGDDGLVGGTVID